MLSICLDLIQIQGRTSTYTEILSGIDPILLHSAYGLSATPAELHLACDFRLIVQLWVEIAPASWRRLSSVPTTGYENQLPSES